MKIGRLLLCGVLALAVTQLPAQEIGSDVPLTPPLGEVDRLEASRPRSERQADQVAATVQVLQARLAHGRGDLSAELRHDQRAWRCDQQAAPLLSEIVALAFQLKLYDEAARYAALAADGELDDPLLLRRLATQLTERRDWARALRLYEQAERLEERSRTRQEKPDLGAVLVRREMGRLYFLTGEYGKSADAFAVVRDAVGNSDSGLSDDAKKLVLDEADESYRLWAEAFLATGRFGEAESLFRQAHAGEAQQAQLAFDLARVALKRRDDKAAREKLDEYFAAKSSAAGIEPYDLLAQLHAGETSDPAAARKRTIERLEQLLAQDVENRALMQALASRYYAAEDWAKAEPLLVAIAARQPAGESAGQLAEIYRRTNRPEKLLPLLAEAAARVGSLESLGPAVEAMAADGPLVKKLAELARQQPAQRGALLAAGHLALDAKEFGSANELFVAASGQESADKAVVYRRWGLGMLLADQPARAAKAFQQMIEQRVDPDDEAESQFHLSAALALAGRTDEALAAAAQAAKLRPSDPQIAARSGWILYHAGRSAEARQSYVAFVERFDSRHGSQKTREAVREARLALSNIDIELGDYAAATEWLQQVLDEFPENVGAGNDLGYLWADHGEHLQRALLLIEQAVKSDPQNAAYRDSLGWAYFRLNRLEDALRELATAAAMATADGVVQDHLGEALQKAGKRDEAFAAWRRAEAAFQKAGESKKLEAIRRKLDQK
jgi:tetratricopeptide (TPR) repeat protein